METEVEEKNIENAENTVVDTNRKDTQKKKSKTKKHTIVALAVIILLLILSTVFAIINMSNTKIVTGVKINNIKVQGLAKEEAMQLIQNDGILQENIKIT